MTVTKITEMTAITVNRRSGGNFEIDMSSTAEPELDVGEMEGDGLGDRADEGVDVGFGVGVGLRV